MKNLINEFDKTSFRAFNELSYYTTAQIFSFEYIKQYIQRNYSTIVNSIMQVFTMRFLMLYTL